MSDTEKFQKTLAHMTAEIVENNTAKGWYEHCATFPEAMALLHSEVSEALEAWRKWGLEDQTKRPGTDEREACADCQSAGYRGNCCHYCKPEGVGSEFADIFIRLLDDCWLFGEIDLDRESLAGFFALSDSFPANMNSLHDLISIVSEAGALEEPAERRFADVLVFLRQCCAEYGIDLQAEYERKMQFNRSRPHRHGGKRI